VLSNLAANTYGRYIRFVFYGYDEQLFPRSFSLQNSIKIPTWVFEIIFSLTLLLHLSSCKPLALETGEFTTGHLGSLDTPWLATRHACKAELKERRWRLARTSKSSHWSESTPSLKTELEADAHAAPPGTLPVSLNNHNDPRRHGLSPRFTWSWALMRAYRSPAEHESLRTLYADRLRLSQAIIDQSGVGKILGLPPAS
jgi:hypothetical protein